MADGHTASFASSAALARVDATIAPGAALDLLRAEGVLVIENVLSGAELNLLRSQLQPWFDAAHQGAGPFFGRATRRFSGLFAKAPATSDLALHPLALWLMESVLKGDASRPAADCIELNLTQAIGIEPGEPAQFLHRDDDLWPFAHDFELMANAMWALDDFTIENGATRLVPGSHTWARDRAPCPGEAAPATARAGSLILWLGGVLHGGGANASTAIRRGVVMSYRLGWLAGGEKLLLSTPPDVARRLPEKLQRLLGYQLHRPNLGWVEGQDPLRWLKGEISALAPVEDNLALEHETLLADVAADPSKYAGYLS